MHGPAPVRCLWRGALAQALGALCSGLWPHWVSAQPVPGTIETITAPGGLYIAKFGDHESYEPVSMAFGPEGRLYIADETIIYRLEEDGSATRIVGEPQPLGAARANVLVDSVLALEARIVPGAMAFDSQGRLYFVDYIDGQGARIARLEDDGTVATYAGTGEFGYGGDGGDARQAMFSFRWMVSLRWSSLAFDPEGNLLVFDFGSGVTRDQRPGGRIRRIDQGRTITTLLHSTATDEHGAPMRNYAGGRLVGDLAFDQEGNLYFCTALAVHRRRPDGVIERVAGTGERGFSGDGGPARAAELDLPLSLTAGRDGQLYIADASNNRIRRVDRSGIIETVAGNGLEHYEVGPCVATDKRLATTSDDVWSDDSCIPRCLECLSALGDGGMAVDATIWWPSHLLLTQEGHLLVAMDGAFSAGNWVGGSFSQLRRIHRVEEYSTAVEGTPHSVGLPAVGPSLAVFPNPFNAQVSITFGLAERCSTNLTVYNIEGQAVRHLVAHQSLGPGLHNVAWDGRTDGGSPVASGSYLIVLDSSGQQRLTRKLSLVR